MDTAFKKTSFVRGGGGRRDIKNNYELSDWDLCLT